MYPSGEDFALVQVIFDDLVRKVCGYTVPRSVARARGILDRALTCSMSVEGQTFDEQGEESDSGYIGSAEAAKLLGVTPRTVTRRAEDLGGQQVSGAWVFDKNEIGTDNDG